MKRLFYVLIVFLPFSTTAQSIFRIDSLPPQGILLDKGWKWHAGDNPDWANPDFDDSKWQSIDPTKDIYDYPQLFGHNISWLRLTFHVTNPILQPPGLSVNQATASEVYLNGQLIHRIGQISSGNIRAEDPLDYPFYIPVDSAGTYHLAIRLVLQPHIRYTRLYALTQNNVFNARLVDLVNTQNAQRDFRVYYTGLEVFKIGLLFMLFVLHLAFYLYAKSNKTHLLLTVYFFGAFMQYVFKILGQNTFSVESRYWYLNISAWLAILGGLFALLAFYRLSKTKIDIYFKIAFFSNIIGAVLSSITYGMLWSILSLISAIINFLVTLRLTRIGLKNKDKGFILLGVAVMVSSLGFVFIELLNQNVPISPYVVDVFFNLSVIAIPIGLSLYMGIEAGERNKELEVRLNENERLKKQAIAQEQEKQQLLATQNERLEHQVTERTHQLQQSLNTLKATQTQLIQKEKMASLGELTAGIAHEIQNPLNFVNNFSEVSVELVDELKTELTKGQIDEVTFIADALSQNLQKINHHGQRAASIVRSMLEHSRTSTGTRQPTDLNALTDEYLRLAYHGLRAKDKTFNCELITNFDPALPNVNMVAQDIGRVLLNLFNNAFYAVQQKALSQESGVRSYQPTVWVSTRLSSGTTAGPVRQSEPRDSRATTIEIRVHDNGLGIPDTIKAKIFQPFFTTKPTGEGTGLGLSLSYDIVTKGHGGIIEMESKEREGTTFTLEFPIT